MPLDFSNWSFFTKTFFPKFAANSTEVHDDKKENKITKEIFDYVVVSTGHFSVPYIPEYEGMKSFPGRILHGHDF